MKLIVDRFEGDYAVCEDENKNMINIIKAALPDGAEEGSVLEMDDGSITVDHNETKRRKKRIKEKMGRMWDNQ